MDPNDASSSANSSIQDDSEFDEHEATSVSHKIGIHYSLFLLYCGICYTMNFITQLIGDVRDKGERTIRDWRAKFV